MRRRNRPGLDPAAAEALRRLRFYREYFIQHRPGWVRDVEWHLFDLQQTGRTDIIIDLNIEGYEEEYRRLAGLPPAGYKSLVPGARDAARRLPHATA